MASVAINDNEHIRKSVELNSKEYEFLFNKLSEPSCFAITFLIPAIDLFMLF